MKNIKKFELQLFAKIFQNYEKNLNPKKLL
jgi:hypothetical protein